MTLTLIKTRELVQNWRPGSYDWTWADECADLSQQHRTAVILSRILKEGIGFADNVEPILLGDDGRVWDGHHRICLALSLGIEELYVEVIGKTLSDALVSGVEQARKGVAGEVVPDGETLEEVAASATAELRSREAKETRDVFMALTEIRERRKETGR